MTGMKNVVIDQMVTAAETMSQIQIEGVRDETGFSNADKFLGLQLAHIVQKDPTDEAAVKSLAALLTAYKRQVSGLVGDASYDAFQALAQGEKVTKADRAKTRMTVVVSVEVDETYGKQIVYRWQGFNENFAFICKDHGCFAKKAENGWVRVQRFDIEAAQATMLALHNAGAKVVGTIEGEQLPSVSTTKQREFKAKITNKVNTKLVGSTLVLSFQYNPEFVAAIKTLPSPLRHYNFADKEWSIRLDAGRAVATALGKAGADVSSLEAFLTDDNQPAPQSAEVIKPLSQYQLDTMYDYQRTGIDFMSRPIEDLRRDNPGSPHIKGVICGDDMGLGKTLMSFISADRIAQDDESILVVCQANTKWKFAKGISGKVGEIEFATGSKQDICLIEDGSTELVKARWYVINYDLLKKFYNRLKGLGFSVLIIDEGQNIKNYQAQRSVLVNGGMIVLEKAVQMYDDTTKARTTVKGLSMLATRRVFVLTGTPIENHTRDLFPLLKAIGHRWGSNFLLFARAFCNPVLAFAAGGKEHYTYNGATNLRQLRRDIDGCFIQRKKTEVLKDLPPKTRDWMPVKVDLDAYYAALERFAQRRDEKIAAAKALGVTLEIGESVLAELTEARVALSDALVPATIERVQAALDAGGKVVVFTAFTNALQQISAHFGDAAVEYHGATSQKGRKTATEAFQDPASDTKVMVANLMAAGSGIEFTAGTYCIMHDLVWNPSKHLQGEDRLYRIGQLANVYVTYMIARGTISEDMADVVEKKLQNINTFEDLGDNDPMFRDLINRMATAPLNELVPPARRKKAKKV
jgi:SWI/SNF-related matrix-associated actin-dependent regulator 1 of chromatin subfamily A